MTEAIREQLSAFVDGELSPVEAELLLKRVERDPALRAALDRYLLLGAAIRSETTGSPSHDFAARVAGALDSEQRGARSWATRMHKRRKPLLVAITSGAVAASVVALALLIAPFDVKSPGSSTSMTADNVAASSEMAATDAEAVGSELDAPTVIPADAVRASQLRQQVENSFDNNAALVSQQDGGRLASYVMAHSQYASPLNRRNVLTGLLVEESHDDAPVSASPPQVAERASASSSTSSDRAMAIR